MPIRLRQYTFNLLKEFYNKDESDPAAEAIKNAKDIKGKMHLLPPAIKNAYSVPTPKKK